METTRTKTAEREIDLNTFANNDDSSTTKERLESILAANAKYARRGKIFRSEKEESEAELMTHPMSNEKAFSIFGLMLGSIPLATVIGKVLYEESNIRGDDFGFVLLFLAATVVTSITGYFSGKTVGKIITNLEKTSWHKMLFALPFLGVLWGLVSGGAGGFLIFLVGAIFGGIIGGMVGGVALPVFTVFHRLLKKGDKIEAKHFYPISIGITAILSAFILGS